jgi:hypothetical protein
VTTGDFVLDAIVTVVGAENFFVGYEDTSPTAKKCKPATLISSYLWVLSPFFCPTNCLTIHRVEQMGPSVHEFERSSVDKDQGMVKKKTPMEPKQSASGNW